MIEELRSAIADLGIFHRSKIFNLKSSIVNQSKVIEDLGLKISDCRFRDFSQSKNLQS